MKIINKKMLVAICTLLMVIFAISIIKPTEVHAGGDGPQLPEITNVNIVNGILSWDAVDGAAKYKIMIEPDLEYYVSGQTSFNIAEACLNARMRTGNYQIGIVAQDSSQYSVSSLYLDNYYYVSIFNEVEPPTNLHWVGHKLVWDSSQDATVYELNAYNISNERIAHYYTAETEFDFSDKTWPLIGNEFTISVEARDYTDDRIPNSLPVVTDYFEGWFIKGYIKNFTISDKGIATWDFDGNADRYVVQFWNGESLIGSSIVYSEMANLYTILEDELGQISSAMYDVRVWAVDGEWAEMSHRAEGQYYFEPDIYYTVTFVMNDGQRSSQNVEKNGFVHAPEKLYKTCCKINGWYLNDSWIGIFNTTNPVTGDITVYGFWEFLFEDLQAGRWYLPYVEYVYYNGLMSGYSGEKEGQFGPNDTINRAQIVTILYRHAGQPASAYEMNFSDIPSSYSGYYYYDAVKWAAENEIVTGYKAGEDAGKFKPNDPVTREQLALILQRYAKYCSKNYTATQELTGFSDAGQVSNYALNGVKWAVKVGIIKGNSDGTLKPKGTATRAEAAAMIERFIEDL